MNIYSFLKASEAARHATHYPGEKVKSLVQGLYYLQPAIIDKPAALQYDNHLRWQCHLIDDPEVTFVIRDGYLRPLDFEVKHITP